MRIMYPLVLPSCLLVAPLAMAQQTSKPAEVPAATVQVTATRFPEDPAKVPTSISVISGKELADRGIFDLRTALALTAGVFIAPGGDAGPASSVPEFWGLKEFDAFLLVVDGVPTGGAFNPALATLNLQDVERIEVQRGGAPVMYGATSFVGVIHVIHRLPADAKGSAELSLGTHGSGSGAVTLKVPKWAGFDSSLTADFTKQGFSDPRTEFERSHIFWRNRMELAEGNFHFDLDATSVDQKPGSPFPRVGKTLSPDVPVDANHNPAGAFLNDSRVTLNTGFDRSVGTALWSTLFSVSRSHKNNLRGFLVDVSNTSPNAHGYRERIDLTDLYFDSHLTWSTWPQIKFVAGVDHLHGAGTGHGGDFAYTANLDGSNPAPEPALEADIRIDDRRDFTGLYGFTQWTPISRLVIETGVRLNRTHESRQVSGLAKELDRTNTRVTGSFGMNGTVWQAGQDHVALFANYRSTFKPAAIDFGLDSKAKILEPESAESYDGGLKAALLDGGLAMEISVYQMDFKNMVVPQGGVLGLTNAGQERFRGMEASLVARLVPDFFARASYSNHDTRFRDYAKDFGGTLTQLAGKRLEMSPYHLAALGLTYAPARGLTGSVEANYVGSVYLNQRNTAPSPGFTTLAASLGYRLATWEFRLNGQNLTDRRNPVAESEMGDAQYYLLPGRQFSASVRVHF